MKIGLNMSVNDITTLLDMAATAENLPSGPDRNDALQSIRRFAAEIAFLLDSCRPVDVGRKAK